MIARVLTVKSTTDWNVSTGARSFSRPARAASLICPCSVRATSDDCRAALTGNELYLNGLNSGTMPSHAAFANAGNTAGQPNTPANRARLVMPIIGDSRMIRSGRARVGSASASSAYFIASAPPLEKPTMCSGPWLFASRRASRTARRVAAVHCSHSTSERPLGTVPWPGRRIATATKPSSA